MIMQSSLKKIPLLSSLLLLVIALSFSSCTKKHTIKPKQALERLLKGNKRYVNNKSEHPNRSEERRKSIASKQTPYAIIVGCSDSRVSPEIIFDEGLGDLFVIRVAGNVIGPIELDSIEYAALYLNSAVILVLGHENCGAVKAVVQDKIADIEAVAELIEPAVQTAKEANTKNKRLLEQSIKNNALNMKNFLENSSNIQLLINEKKIQVRAAYYNLKTGRVELLKDQTPAPKKK